MMELQNLYESIVSYYRKCSCIWGLYREDAAFQKVQKFLHKVSYIL